MKLYKTAFALFLCSCASSGNTYAVADYIDKPRTGSSRNIEIAQIETSFPKPVDKPVITETSEYNQADFMDYVEGFKLKALNAGISPATVSSALDNAKMNETVIRLDTKQPEKSEITKEQYLANVINDARIQKGKRLLAENRTILNHISSQTGVEPEFIVALWGLESGFGERMGDFSIINSLATLAYEGRRREFFENELMSALLIIDQGNVTAAGMKGSWAGAMGQCQFMPSSYLNYAVDYNKDGRIDIWNTREDVFASIANYLRTVGWGPEKAQKEKTLMHWNRSSYFVASVFKLAELIK